MDFGKSFLPDHPVVHTWSRCSLGPALRAVGFSFSSPGSVAWGTTNKVLYIPFQINQLFLAQKMFIYNGTTASGNFDVGIYDVKGTKLVSSGSTAQSGTSVLQIIDITDTLLAPGTFYFALVFDNATGTVQRNAMTSASLTETMGILEQTSTFPLPTTAAMATSTTTILPYMGAVKRTVI